MTANNLASKADLNSYFEDRLVGQLEWYDRKSSVFKKRYFLSKLTIIVVSALIPFLSAYVESIWWFKILLGIMGVSIAIVSGMLMLFKYHENWINYRRTAELLKAEMYAFQARIGEYASVDDTENEKLLFKTLSTRVEGILATEISNWIGYQSEKEEKKE